MATYKQPCLHCGYWLDTAEAFCPSCGSHSPFGYACPQCLHAIQKDWRLCPGCGRALYIACPHCGQPCFVEDNCEACGQTLMVRCTNKRCGVLQFFQNTRCTACGLKIKAKLTTSPRKETLR